MGFDYDVAEIDRGGEAWLIPEGGLQGAPKDRAGGSKCCTE